MDRRLYKKARSGHADLARIAENGRNSAGHRGIEIGRIGKNDIGRLSAKFQIDPFQVGGRRVAHDAPPDWTGPGKDHHIDIHGQGHRLANRLAAARYNIENAGGKSGLMRQLAHPKQRQRGAFTGFDHHGITAGKCRAEFPCADHQREIPRDDGPDDTDRFFMNHSENVTGGRRDLAIDLVTDFGIIAERCRRRPRLCPEGHADFRPVVTNPEDRQFAGIGLYQICPAMHHSLARRRCHFRPAPVLEGLPRHRNGMFDGGCIAVRQSCQKAAVDGRDHLYLVPCSRCVTCAVDQMACRCDRCGTKAVDGGLIEHDGLSPAMTGRSCHGRAVPQRC